MKKLLCVLAVAACLCMVLAAPAAAKEDPLAVKFQDALHLLDSLYDYGPQYMVKVANDNFISYDDEEWMKTVPAAEYEAVLHKYFVIDDAMLQRIRTYDEGLLEYNADSNTYTVYMGGGFGGILPPREYHGYVKVGARYEVYYRQADYEFLADVLPEGTTEEDIVGEDWPPEVAYGGNTYESGPEGYYRTRGYMDAGRKYTVELNGDVVRIVSCTEYTGGPGKFDDGSAGVEYEIPQDSSVVIPENDCFEADTVVKVEQITQGQTMQTVTQTMASVAEKYVAYEFTATKNNAAVQPNGKLAVTFAIPEGYSEKVQVYYMAPDGALEKLSGTVDPVARVVKVELEHFSTYILVDEETAHVHEFGEVGVVIEPPTAEKPGLGRKTCKTCGYSEEFTLEYVPGPGAGEGEQTTQPAGDEDKDTNDGEDGGKNDPDYTVIILVAVAAAVIVAAVVTVIVIRKKKA